jgi:hypothetical protein
MKGDFDEHFLPFLSVEMDRKIQVVLREAWDEVVREAPPGYGVFETHEKTFREWAIKHHVLGAFDEWPLEDFAGIHLFLLGELIRIWWSLVDAGTDPSAPPPPWKSKP